MILDFGFELAGSVDLTILPIFLRNSRENQIIQTVLNYWLHLD